jgi:hypothetical protein
MENIEEVLASDISSLNSQCEEFTNPPIPPPGPDESTRMENIMEALDSDISPDNSQSVEAREDTKMNEQYGNVIENKRSSLEDREENRNVIETTGSYVLKTGMLLKKR